LSDFAHGIDLAEVVAVEVTTDSREVTHWAQPLIRQSQPEIHTLVAQLRKGQLHVLLRATTEPGLYNGCEYSTTSSSNSVTSEVGNTGEVAAHIRDTCRDSEVLLEIEQSDEGGRFFQVIGQYRVVLASENSPWPEDSVLADSGYVWVGLWELMELCRASGSTTNELRSATSMLLSWL
jgi:oxidase EvaA